MHQTFKPNALHAAVVAVFGVAAVAAAPTASAQRSNDTGRYVVGDFHNHTTCSDGQISVQRLVNKSVDTYGLDWFAMVGHGGSGNRNCTLVDDAQTGETSGFPFIEGQGPSTTWVNSVGAAAIKGDLIGTDPNDPNRRMWRWQSIEEYQYPVLERMTALKQKPLFVGLEQVNPGHEHTDVSVVDGQLAAGGGNAAATAEYEYCFDRGDGDLSRGGDGARFNCAVGGSPLNTDLDVRGQKLIGVYNSGELGHQKSLEGVKWLGENYPTSSFFIPAHVERAGVFNPNGNAGFNIEHFRNFNNAAPTVAFGYEGGPGHQASSSRSYRATSPGGGTFGGAGYYMAKVGGFWDALLGEGRNFWIFNNSDYHNRGAFGPDDARSTNDQYPGEFNKSYVLVKDGITRRSRRNGEILTPQEIVDGMRTGNSWYVNGDLIDRLGFVACTVRGRNRAAGRNLFERQIARAALAGEGFENPNCAQQGEKLVVNPGDDVFVHIVVRDPQGTNGSVYTIPNPSLAQVGINIPLNAPVLDHVDLIGGMVTGYVSPDSPLYAGAAPGGVLRDAEGNVIPDSPAALNPSTGVRATFGPGNWDEYRNGERRMFHRINDVTRSQYIRLRGTNIPASVPFETDANGNPLLDLLANNITVTPDPVACASAEAQTNDPNCLAHLPAQGAGRQLNNDVEAWTDLWFYSNPIYIEVRGGTVVAGVQ